LYNCDGPVTNCIISNNYSARNGGALAHCDGPITNCIISDNTTARGRGGGLYYSKASIINCVISGNSAGPGGGGLYWLYGSIKNCIISGNRCVGAGGGVDYCFGPINNCTIVGNSAQDSAGALNGCAGPITNCIIWDNRPSNSAVARSSVPLFGCIQGGSDGTGCISPDPRFVLSGNWDPNGTPGDMSDDFWIEGNYHLRPESDCVDAGNYAYCMALPHSDLDGNTRLTGGRIDIGCYETHSSPDSDGDWLADNLEPGYADNPDRDQDGIFDGVELLRGTNPDISDPLGQLNVPTDANTVQEALFFGRSGETIVLDEGTYYENIYIGGRNSILTGTDPDDTSVVAMTVINADTDANPLTPNGRVINFLGTENASCQIRGLTITGGYDAGMAGGIHLAGAHAGISHCIIADNTAGNDGIGLGGGIYGSDGTISGCTIIGNSAPRAGGVHCGPMWGYVTSPTLTNCNISYNYAGDEGGGMYIGDSDPKLTNCVISNNSAGNNGGGLMFGNDNFTTMTNCLVTGNSTGNNGGGMYCVFCFKMKLTNCTFSGNSAGNHGGGMHNEFDCYITATNCVFWNNTPEGIFVAQADPPTINYSCIQGGWLGSGNIDADPGFVDELNEDYHLLPTSPCIDTGDPNYIAGPNETDLDGRPRVISGRIDMGAYEAPIFAEARILPRTINLASKGNWLTCYIWLPDEYDVADVDPNSIFLENEIQPVQFSVDEQAQVATARFIREDVQAILGVGDIDLKISGQLTDGTYFEATEVIKVVDKAGLK
jgi:hypothetical protein